MAIFDRKNEKAFEQIVDYYELEEIKKEDLDLIFNNSTMFASGGIKQDIFIWSLADFGLGIMTVINILVIIPIAKPALDSLKSYEKELK